MSLHDFNEKIGPTTNIGLACMQKYFTQRRISLLGLIMDIYPQEMPPSLKKLHDIFLEQKNIVGNLSQFIESIRKFKLPETESPITLTAENRAELIRNLESLLNKFQIKETHRKLAPDVALISIEKIIAAAIPRDSEFPNREFLDYFFRGSTDRRTLGNYYKILRKEHDYKTRLLERGLSHIEKRSPTSAKLAKEIKAFFKKMPAIVMHIDIDGFNAFNEGACNELVGNRFLRILRVRLGYYLRAQVGFSAYYVSKPGAAYSVIIDPRKYFMHKLSLYKTPEQLRESFEKIKERGMESFTRDLEEGIQALINNISFTIPLTMKHWAETRTDYLQKISEIDPPEIALGRQRYLAAMEDYFQEPGVVFEHPDLGLCYNVISKNIPFFNKKNGVVVLGEVKSNIGFAELIPATAVNTAFPYTKLELYIQESLNSLIAILKKKNGFVHLDLTKDFDLLIHDNEYVQQMSKAKAILLKALKTRSLDPALRGQNIIDAAIILPPDELAKAFATVDPKILAFCKQFISNVLFTDPLTNLFNEKGLLYKLKRLKNTPIYASAIDIARMGARMETYNNPEAENKMMGADLLDTQLQVYADAIEEGLIDFRANNPNELAIAIRNPGADEFFFISTKPGVSLALREQSAILYKYLIRNQYFRFDKQSLSSLGQEALEYSKKMLDANSADCYYETADQISMRIDKIYCFDRRTKGIDNTPYALINALEIKDTGTFEEEFISSPDENVENRWDEIAKHTTRKAANGFAK